MSFIGRIAARATADRSVVTPKGYVRRARQEDEQEELPAQTLRRQEQEQEEPVQTLRRQQQEEEEAMQTLRRQAPAEQEEEEPPQALQRQEEEEEEEPVQTLRRQEQDEEEEHVQMLRRQEEEEEPVQMLRRQEEEEEPLQTLRRQVEEEEEEMQALRRAAADPQSLDLVETPMPEETRDEAEPPTVTALRREVMTTANSGVNDFIPGDSGLVDPGIGIHAGVTGPDKVGDSFNRPSVQIDQLDVLIHEPVQSGGTSRSVDRSRSIRTRYLRRL